MTDYQRPPGREDFEVAFICALEREYDAVCLILDYSWDEQGDSYGRVSGDFNQYTTGRIGEYNVVVLLAPTGQVSLASATTSLRISFPGVKMALVVGVCHAVPRVDNVDVRFGDVVISKTVFQHDFGRQYPDRFERKDTTEDELGPAAKDIRGLLKIFGTDDGLERLKSRTAVSLEQLQVKARSKNQGERWQVPHMEEFGQSNAANASAPAIFLGPIASGSSVIKSQAHRDKLAKYDGAVAFEMAGPRVWPELPCLVVKGVCDYGGVQKNTRWQGFAAATAAATAKAILQQYAQNDKPASAAVPGPTTATQEGSTYTGLVQGKRIYHGNDIEVASTQPLRNYLQKGSQFGSNVESDEDVRQGNKMIFSQ
ncbi:hypothetical protein QQZ08_011352 [Neonectria magnoliae]|uniref:Nucleoside phosphorylase domain-containing protein n=1 Tax=Neonectria magnoliae TaxID=2732573 RepID=A0ABR1HAW9_9HYPO